MKINLKVAICLLIAVVFLGCSNEQLVNGSLNEVNGSRTITIPSIPENLFVYLKRPTTLGLTWSHIENAVKYKIYYRSQIADTKKISVIESSTNRYEIKGLPKGDIIDFWVTAIDYSGAESKASKVLTEKMDCSLTKPTGLKEIGVTETTIRLKWDVSGELGGKYTVYLNSESGLKTAYVYTNYIEVTDLEPNTNYYIYIEQNSGKVYRSDFSDGIVVKTKAPVYDEWVANKVYVKGDRVQYKGVSYEAKWWNLNQAPSDEPYGPWDQLLFALD